MATIAPARPLTRLLLPTASPHQCHHRRRQQHQHYHHDHYHGPHLRHQLRRRRSSSPISLPREQHRSPVGNRRLLLPLAALALLTASANPAGVPEGAFSEDAGAAAAARERIFGKISGVYDVLNDVLSLGLHRLWKRNAVRRCEVQPGDRALDVCCGSGDLARMLASSAGPSGAVVGLDFAAPMLEYAASKTKKDRKNAQIEWMRGDAMDLPFPDDDFDGVTVGYGLRNVADIDKCLQELNRVTKPGKKVVVLDFNNARNLLVRNFQFFCLQYIVVPVATLCGVREEYAYLKPSIERYPTGDGLIQKALDSGFETADFIPVAGGLMGMLVATTKS